MRYNVNLVVTVLIINYIWHILHLLNNMPWYLVYEPWALVNLLSAKLTSTSGFFAFLAIFPIIFAWPFLLTFTRTIVLDNTNVFNGGCHIFFSMIAASPAMEEECRDIFTSDFGFSNRLHIIFLLLMLIKCKTPAIIKMMTIIALIQYAFFFIQILFLRFIYK